VIALLANPKVAALPRGSGMLQEILDEANRHHQTTNFDFVRVCPVELDLDPSNPFCGGDKHHTLMCHDGKTALPPSLQQETTDWHHEMPCHPSTTRTEATITRQHCDWKGLCTMAVATFAKNANFAKNQKLLAKNAVNSQPNRPRKIHGTHHVST
jgi:hypothetical protein